MHIRLSPRADEYYICSNLTPAVKDLLAGKDRLPHAERIAYHGRLSSGFTAIVS